MRLPQLKVKIKSLSAEARIIRHQEYKQRDSARRIKFTGKKKVDAQREIEQASLRRLNEELHLHRVGNVREESRHSQLAYGFLRGKPYKAIENFSYEMPKWAKVEAIAQRFGVMDERELQQKFAEWKSIE